MKYEKEDLSMNTNELSINEKTVNSVKNKTISQKAQKWLIAFFVTMIGLTILSHIADSLTVPKVKVSNAKNSSLSLVVSGNGNITDNANKYIKVEENLRAARVYIKSGDKVNEGDVLFEYDLEEVKRLYDETNNELQKVQIEVSKLTLNKDKQTQDTGIYNVQVDNLRAQEDMQKAKDEVVKAKNEYEKAYEKAKEKAEKQASDDVKEKQEAYHKAEKNYTDVKIANNEDILKSERDVEDAEDKLRKVKKYCKDGDDDDDEDHIYTKSDVRSAEKDLERASDDLENTKNKCEYNLKNAEEELKKAEEELKKAGQEPFDYDSELSSVVDKIDSSNKNLSEALRKSQDTRTILDDESEKKIIEKNNAEVQKEIDNLDIDSENLGLYMIQKKADKLNEILNNQGKVLSPVSGTVNKMELEEGKTASGQEFVSISFDKCSLKGMVSKEDAGKIAAGDEVYVKVNEKQNPVETIVQSIGIPDKDDMVEITAVMPDNSYPIGLSVNFEIKKNSKKYDKCIPIEALRSDKEGKYVLVVSEKETVLGRECVASRIDVEVIDNNYLNVAVSGDLSTEEDIIINSSRSIEKGDRVRVDEDV